MNPMRTLLAALVASFAGAMSAQDLASAMAALNLRDALVVQSQAVDEHPVWSPSGKQLAVNIEGQWMQVDLDPFTLKPGTWRGGQPIGVADPPAKLTPMQAQTVNTWGKGHRWAPRKIETRGGTVVELRQEELSTVFVITRRGQSPQTLWRSGLENCHSLALAPDEKRVAFICETNGVIVTQL
jgi:hypothetical protein